MNKYDDIISLPHHVSPTHPQMSIHDRAAQFSPFAALTGHSDAVEETARLTEEERILDENMIEDLNKKLQGLKTRLPDHPVIKITFFSEDIRKAGGEYRTIEASVRKIDENRQELILDAGTVIPMRHIRHMVCYASKGSEDPCESESVSLK